MRIGARAENATGRRVTQAVTPVDKASAPGYASKEVGRMKTRQALTAVFAIATVAVAGLANGPAWAATTESNPLKFRIHNEIYLMADGAAAAVPVSYQCIASELFGGNFGWATLSTTQVQQKRQQTIVSFGYDVGGQGGQDPSMTCDGRWHTAQLLVLPIDPNAFRFNLAAKVTVDVLACDLGGENCLNPEQVATAAVRPAPSTDPLNMPAPLTAHVAADGQLVVALPHSFRSPSKNSALQVIVSERSRRGKLIDASVDYFGRHAPVARLSALPGLHWQRGRLAYFVVDSYVCVGVQCREGHIVGVTKIT